MRTNRILVLCVRDSLPQRKVSIVEFIRSEMSTEEVCGKFRPNYWRPTTCSNCLRPKVHHDRATTTCTSSSNKKTPLIGVVTPYAVVKVRNQTDNYSSQPKHSNPRTSTPKRKAPPPPQIIKRELKKDEEVLHNKHVGSQSVVRRKTAPRKPPRTLSTFLSDSNSIAVAKDPQCYVGGHLADLMADTVRSVYAKFLEHAVRPDPLWELGWHHFSLLSSNTAVYKGLHMNLQKIPSKYDQCQENDIEISQRLSPHPHLNVIRAVLPPSTLPPLCSSSHYLLRDGYGVGTLAELLPAQRESCSPVQLRELLLHCMVQVLSAVDYIYSRGVSHRDIGLECLSVSYYGDHWLVKLGHFNYAVQHSGTKTRSPFVYSFSELSWLGGADSRLPPEILNASEESQTLDYSGTDIFAVGCLFYEFLGQKNPFEVNSKLIKTSFTSSDLPCLHLATTSIQKLAHHLLSRELSSRPSPDAALLLCQSLMWLQPHCLHETCQEKLVQYIDYDRGLLVSSLAIMDLRPVPLPHILHANFLRKCRGAELCHNLDTYQLV